MLPRLTGRHLIRIDASIGAGRRRINVADMTEPVSDLRVGQLLARRVGVARPTGDLPGNQAMKTSVLIPVYNASATLGATLESIAHQSVRVDEVIVVDDGSSDDTFDVVERWSQVLPIKALRHLSNKGFIRSLQDAAASASGDLLLRVDGDDTWMETHVENLLRLAAKHPNVGLFSARAVVCDQAGATIRSTLAVASSAIRPALMWDNPLTHSSVCMRRTVYDDAGGYAYSPQFRSPLNRVLLRRMKNSDLACDYALWIRMLSVGEYCGGDQITVRYSETSRSLSRVRRSEAIAIRFVHQREAIALFWRLAPIRAILSLCAGMANLAASVAWDTVRLVWHRRSSTAGDSG